jgi:hypothetical protein
VVAFLLATVPVLAQSAILDPLAPQEQIVLGAPNWNFGPDVTPDISLDHRRMVVSEGCDVNGDGYDDILVGRRDFTHSTTTHAGRAWLFLGGPNGLSATPSLIFTPPVLNTYGFFGTMVACVGDINGDGFEDFAIGNIFQQFAVTRLMKFFDFGNFFKRDCDGC